LKKIIKSIFLRGYSPIYYLKKYSNIFPLFFKIVEKNKNVNNEIISLQNNGYVILKSNEKLLQQAYKKCNLLAQGHKINYNKKGKSFWNIILKNEELIKFDEINNYVTNSFFIDLAQAYLNSKPVLANVDLIISFPNDQPINHSQMWHLDADDTKICTFYLYCSDVDKNSGPFKLAPKNKSKNKIIPKWFRKYGYMNDYFFKSICAAADIKELTGKSKFEFVCDTANTYHCGSYCIRNTRLVLTFRYVSESPLYNLSEWSKNFNLKKNE
tara:strand:- start:143 stop:949 length:807 start_codon:yes stop_codon:yes gene_type:complete